MLPDFDGMEVLRRLRAQRPDVPVLFLTARDAVEDRVAGLTAGGDDYVTKPFSLEEVVARLRGLMRRSGAADHAASNVLTVGDLVLDEDSHEVRRGGEQIELTATEFELLRYLMRNPRRVLSKAQILDRVWNYDFGGQANVVELYISYLRKKIDAGRRADDPHDARRGLRPEAGATEPDARTRPHQVPHRPAGRDLGRTGGAGSVLVVLATTVVMHQYLTSRLDQQVHASLDRAVHPDEHGPDGQGPGDGDDGAFGRRPQSPAHDGRGAVRVPARGRGARATPTTTIEALSTSAVGQLDELPVDGKARTVALDGLGDYRVVAIRDSQDRVLATGLPMTEIHDTIESLLLRSSLLACPGSCSPGCSG